FHNLLLYLSLKVGVNLMNSQFTQFFCLTVAEDQKVRKPCCTKVSTANVTDPIINIRLQRKSLPCVKAVIFETEQGEFCRDPKLRWVKEKVKHFL
uniref:Chemokine interleukin-8-like domain-containing protein n=1 Tax=Cyprinus carpio TaxID=7962 RepID=A0A8C2K4U3_CYPCA